MTPMSIVPQVLPSFGCRDLIPALKGTHAKHNLSGDEIVIRSFQPDRLDLVLTTGTDRDDTSQLYDVPRADSSAQTRSEFGVQDSQVTYAHLVDLADTTITNTGKPVSLCSHLGEGRAEDKFSAYAVYSPEKLRKAPDGQVEFWFQGDPKDALLAVFTHAETTQPSEATDPVLAREISEALATLQA